jgi:hypothetical protein
MTVTPAESRKATNKPLDPVLVGWAMFLFFPLGLYLLWRHPTLGRNAKWWASGIAWACVLLMFSGRDKTERAIDPQSEMNGSTAASGSAPGTLTKPQTVKRSFWGPRELAYSKRIDLCDNPDQYKDIEMRMEVKYNGGGRRVGSKLVSMPTTVFYGDGSFNMQFDIPSDVTQGRIEPGQYLMVTYVFCGSVDSPSRVVAISRK